MQKPAALPTSFVFAAAALLACGALDEVGITDAAYGYDVRPANPSCRAPARPRKGSGVKLTPVFAEQTFQAPLAFLQAPGDPSRFFVVEQAGLVKAVPAAGGAATPFIDIRARVRSGGETGLLGMAFHPKWPDTPELFLSYTLPGGSTGLRSTVVRMRSNDGGHTIDVGTETPVIAPFEQPYSNHNGGALAFGKDGYLYIGFGDGGSGGDPLRNGQNVNVVFGKILRVDIDGGAPYGIPADNPFAGGGGLKEIYAFGIRNPWRFSFDRVNGDLWLGDVGQGEWEEVDKVVRGGNYGWNTREGRHCYRKDSCATDGLLEPVAEYDHSQGASITGGYVYRGSAITALIGSYLYGDYSSGRIWGTFADATGQPQPRVLIAESGANISSFGEDLAGELYVTSHRAGKILKFVPDDATELDTLPQKLSETGCVAPSNAREIAEGVIPYGVQSPFWSDGADKRRYFAIPDGTRITVRDDGDWDFPIGTVTMKTFLLGDRRVETRLFVRHEDGDWAGYTYAWNDAQTDAELLDDAKSTNVGGQTWTFPSRAECMTCHTEAGGRSLGLETAQLNATFEYPTRRRSNQLATLEHLGYFEPALNAPPDQLPALPKPATGTAADLEVRARSYLHANCSNSHRPGGTGGGTMDLRFGTPFVRTNLCDAVPAQGDLGTPDARLLAPGDPARSVISVRPRTLDRGRMPPLASRVVDVTGTTLVDDWIRAVRGCPPP